LAAKKVRILGLDPYVRFLGQRNDVAAIMGALDLLVMNSRSEAFPLVALEGMAVGVPVWRPRWVAYRTYHARNQRLAGAIRG